jgi:ribonucleoside-triphosphate reductase
MSEIAKYKFQSSYAKYIDELGRKETWPESVDRVMQMHHTKLINKVTDKKRFNEYLAIVKKAYKNKTIAGSQRALQFGGAPILKHNSKMYNCLTSYCDRPQFFNECMYWLLSGCGVGFSVQTKHVEKLPNLIKREKGVKTFIIQDSIEGWADAVGVLLGSYLENSTFEDFKGYRIDFDFSLIRPRGSMISGGFKAPGPDGLRTSLIKVQELLDKTVNSDSFDGIFKSIVAYDVVMHMSDAVLSGGVRRSATICLFSPEDEDMLNAKTGDWYINNPQRARSNNSVLLVKNKTTRAEFAEIMKSVKNWGEPGFVWSEDEDILYNPCVEIGMYPQTEEGISGWQGCNLTTIVGGKIKTKEDFLNACIASAIMGTIQASYTDFKYVGKETKRIFDREALLGCSLTGWMENPTLLFDPALQREGAELIKKINKEVAELIGINQAARTTCVKPEGNSSVLFDTSSGIHAHHFKRYFRNVQVNKEEDEGKFFTKINPKAVEESVWSANNTDWVFSFPVEAPEGSIFKESVLGVKQLEYVKLTQQNWVESGTNVELCMKPYIRHNVSNTINVDDWDEVEEYIYNNKEWFAGISLLSATGDRDFTQAPFQAVYTPKEINKMYGDASIFASGLIVDGLHCFDNLWQACDTTLGFGLDLSEENAKNAVKRDWIRRAKKFATNYFDNDIKKMTYCLKDVHNYKRWSEINREMKSIDWKEVAVSPKYTDIDTMGSIACAGGQCEI